MKVGELVGTSMVARTRATTAVGRGRAQQEHSRVLGGARLPNGRAMLGALLVVVSRQVFEHKARPPLQMQVPPEQLRPDGHGMLHPPQFRLSVLVLVSQPFA